MRIIFAGTPHFAEIALEALIHSKHEIIAVYTQPDRAAGRGLKLMQSPVKTLALNYQLPIYQPVSLKETHEQDLLAGLKSDVMVVAAYGMLLPQAVLSIPPKGCINIHPSLLPRFRGAAPIPRAIYAGDQLTGVSIMQMDMGLDTGPILLQEQLAIESDDTAQSLHDKLARVGAAALLKSLDLLSENKLQPIPQDNQLATYAHKMTKEEALIDWERSALEIEREIRAFNPWPVAYTSWQGKNLRIWFAKVIANASQDSPRTLVSASEDGVDIATGQGVLRLLKLQLPGAKPIEVVDFYHAQRDKLILGEKFI